MRSHKHRAQIFNSSRPTAADQQDDDDDNDDVRTSHQSLCSSDLCPELCVGCTERARFNQRLEANQLWPICAQTQSAAALLVCQHSYIDGNGVMRLTFDPNSGDYGSHHYGNFEELLVPLYRGSEYQYYTIGNIYQETSMPLPPYVVRPRGEYEGRNRDRIIIRIREQNIGGRASQRIDQVYLTQHVEHQGEYDPDQTYRITTNLLRQIREFSVGQNQQQLLTLRNRYGSNAEDFQLRHIRDTWGGLAGLGLLLFIVIEERFTSNQQNRQSHWVNAFILLILFFIFIYMLLNTDKTKV